jgi:hypothetical protein
VDCPTPVDGGNEFVDEEGAAEDDGMLEKEKSKFEGAGKKRTKLLESMHWGNMINAGAVIFAGVDGA